MSVDEHIPPRERGGEDRRAGEEEAALWAARIDSGAFGAGERAALSAWLANNPAHGPLLADYRQLSGELDTQLPALVAAGAFALPPEAPPPPRRRWGFWGLAAGAFAAALGAAATLWLTRPDHSPETFATAAAQRQSFTLADGTRVELNARTRLLIESDRSERRVRLGGGEAFFVVTKDRARPFVVETPGGSVRVTGTIFDVRSESAGQLEVTVLEGSVQVRPSTPVPTPPGLADDRASAPVMLGAGNRLTATHRGVAVEALSGADLEDAMAWRQGSIVFDHGTPLSEALARFAWYHGRVITAAPDAAALMVGGRYSLDDLEGFFAKLQDVLPVTVAHEAGGAVRVSRRNEP